MKKHSQFQQGFADIILIVVVAVLVAGLGGYVYYRQQQANKTYNAAGNGVVVATNTKKPAADPTASWTAFSSKTGKFSLKYNPKWLKKVGTDTGCIGDDSVIYLAPDSSSLPACGAENISEVTVTSLAGDQRSSMDNFKSDFTNAGYPGAVQSSVTVDGIAGHEYVGTYTVDIGGPWPPLNSKLIEYIFYTNGRTYDVSYIQAPKYSDVSSDFNLMVTKTLKFSS